MRRLSRLAPRSTSTERLAPRRTRAYNFASSQYNAAFGDLPPVDRDKLRKDALAYMERFDAQKWYDDPVATCIAGKPVEGGESGPTYDNFGRENGIVLQGDIDGLLDHLRAFDGVRDQRSTIRKVERALFTDHAAALIGNQTLDFGKQDGVTEIEEALEASEVERRLVDQLLDDEERGVLRIERAPVLVACVSNFSNFLDLSRKTLRNLECGIPVVVLSRTGSTTQYPYRWYQLLVAEMERHGVDAKYASFASCDLDKQIELCRALGDASPLHITSSRQTAVNCNATHGNVIASTGGPNTMVVSGELDGATGALLRDSATIEHAGQCTALRVAVLDARHVALDAVHEALRGAAAPATATDALATDAYAGLFPGAPSTSWGEDYVDCDRVNAKTSDAMPRGPLDEGWRQPVVDLSIAKDFGSDAHVLDVSNWLVQRQPISLAVNGDLTLSVKLWERTAMVVVTVGGCDGRPPASTCQARPQDGEIFGEVPPRKELRSHTRFPVYVPSAAPAYNASYDASYLKARSDASFPSSVAALMEKVEDPAVRGYCSILVDYLGDACGPRTGPGKARETLYGWQRPPLHLRAVFRVEASTSIDDVAPSLVLFLATNARDQLVVSVEKGGEALVDALSSCGVDAKVEARFDPSTYYDAVSGADLRDRYCTYPLAQQFASLYLTVGHAKSTLAKDGTFVAAFAASPKWLRVVE